MSEFISCIDPDLYKGDPIWLEILTKLSPAYPYIEELLVYFVEERLITSGNMDNIKLAREIYNCVNQVDKEAFQKFEDENWDYLAAIDYRLKGFSNWSNKPAFTL